MIAKASFFGHNKANDYLTYVFGGNNMYYYSRIFTPYGSWTSGVEGPACDKDGNLFAVNYAYNGTIGKITPEGKGKVFLVLPEGSIGNGIRMNALGELLIADYTGHNILRAHPHSGEVTVYAHNPKWFQPNDLAISQKGLLYISDPDWPGLKGRIWVIYPDGNMRLVDDQMGTTNGIEVSSDEHTLYVNESEQRKIWAYDLDSDGIPCNKRLFIAFNDYGLDGMRCDIEGNLYVTRYHKGTILKLDPQGHCILEVYLHGKRCSNLCFGGKDGCTCYVTMADTGCIETFRTEAPGREWRLNRIWQQA